jgi:AsmA protein
VTAAKGYKRVGLAVTGVLAAVFAALVGVTYLISADSVREAIKAEIRNATGLDPLLRGDVSISLFPTGVASFSDVLLGDDRTGQPAVLAERMTARLSFFPLLAGRIEVADVTLVRPTITVVMAPDGKSNWTPLIESFARAVTPSPKRVASFSEIRIGEGTIVFRDDERGILERLNNVEIVLGWPSISKSFAANGRFLWRDEQVTASVTLTDFLAALNGNRAGVKVRLSGAPLKFAFDGAFSRRPTFKAEGTLAADSISLRDALRWIGTTPLPGGGFGRFALKAQTSVVGGTISLSRVNVELDGNTAEGVLTFATDGRKTVQGTLAAEAVDLTPYVSTVRLLTGNDREWNQNLISLEGLTGFDLDLRLSAARIAIANAKLGRTAIATNLRAGRLTVTVGESQGFDGIIKGSFGVASVDSGAELKAQLHFSNVKLETSLTQLFGIRRLEGRGTLTLNIEGSGRSVLGLTHRLNGTATLAGEQGALTGLNVEQLLRRLERRPLSGGGDFRSGRTPYDKLAVSLKIVQGAAAIEAFSFDGPAVKLMLGGAASIPGRNLDLQGTASLLANASGPGFDLPFVVQGPWDDPLMLPDPQSLIRRSGAAAPLLDAVRGRSARDAVRSAIERITGTGTASPAAGTDPAAAQPSEPK